MEDFEKIFKEKLEKHNGKVKAGAWAGISAGVAGQAATGSGIFSSTALTYVASIAATIAITSSVIIWNYSDKSNSPLPCEKYKHTCLNPLLHRLLLCLQF